MARRRPAVPVRTTYRDDSGPVSIIEVGNGGKELPVVDDAAEPTDCLSPGARAALGAIGRWSGLDWDETIENLERIRRESKPSPPLDDL